MTIQHLPDGSLNPAWVKERQGKLGASKIDNILNPLTGKPKEGKKKGAPSEMRQTLAKQLAAERFTGFSCGYANPNDQDLKRGNDLEPVALAAYEARYGVFLEPAQWIEHPDLPFSGCTPDGIIVGEGLVQIKAPRLGKFTSIVIDNEIPDEYIGQLTWEQAVTRLPWTDFGIYCAEMPPGKRLWVKRYSAPIDLLAAYEEQVRIFLAEVEMYFDFLTKTDFATTEPA